MKQKMLAGVFEDVGVLAVKEVPVPTILGDRDVIIRVDAASICGSDLKILEVPPAHPARTGVIMGHEYLGTVAQVGKAVTELQIGDRAVVEPNIPCGRCAYCRELSFHMCSNLETLGETVDGGFAEFCLVPATQLHKVPKGTPVEEAVFTEPLTCALGALGKVRVTPGDTAVVFGAGPLGLLFLELLLASGAKTVMVEPSADRREIATRVGADLVVDSSEEGMARSLATIAPLGFHLAIDCVGSLFARALPIVRRNGTLLLFGLDETSECALRQYDITRNNWRVVGSFIGSGDFPRAIDIISSGRIDVRPLISAKIALSEIATGVELLRNRQAIKVIVVP